MADSKGNYSGSSKNFISKTVPNSKEAKHYYDVSKQREEKYNDKWSNKKVNINDVVEKFTPNSTGRVEGYKYIFESERYQVVADMVAGYLRIKDIKTNQYVKLDRKPGSNDETHLKIKKRGEM